MIADTEVFRKRRAGALCARPPLIAYESALPLGGVQVLSRVQRLIERLVARLPRSGRLVEPVGRQVVSPAESMPNVPSTV